MNSSSEAYPLISAYLPCYNNAATIGMAVQSVLSQTVHVSEVLVIDDGSADGSPDVARASGARVLMQPGNFGRGAARARGMQEARSEYVLCCDATNMLPPRFAERALAWFGQEQVAAVFGRIGQPPPHSLAHRWRGRHLFHTSATLGVNRQASLATYGMVARRSALLAVGNFDARLRHSEDVELGERLKASNFEVVFDPELVILSTAENTLAQVLERYWRWHAGKDEGVSWRHYLRQISYSVKVMAQQDLAARDPLCVPISLFSPHYQFWRSWRRGRPLYRGGDGTPRL